VSPRRRSTEKEAPVQERKCPECGRIFGRAQALGAHRRQAHGVAGASKRSRARATANRRSGQRRSPAGRANAATSRGARNGRPLDRDRLLQTLFPEGIPAREDVLRAADAWLAEAERMTRMR
jgi:uncharacterized C2H2 Zn-finger protein